MRHKYGQTYCDTIRDPLIIVTSNSWRIDHILADQFDRGVSDCWRAVQEMTFDGMTDVGLDTS